MLDASEYSCSSIEPFITTPSSSSRRAKKIKNKRRFSDEQIRSLETLFESETRLEPRKKLQLAKELGLQPRQVAIWFQNKRARWKSKQLERDYSVLRANYNTLASKFESLKKEKQALALQLQKLNDKSLGSKTTSSEGESGNREAAKCESSEAKACDELIGRSSAQGLGVLSDEGSSVKTEYFGLDEEEKANLMSIMQTTDGSLTTSQDDWESLDSDDLFGQSNSGGQWWDFWA